MMLSAEATADVVEILQGEDFYRSANGRIFDALRELYARGEPVDQLSAVEALRRKGILDDVGGPLYIRDLADQVPTPASAAHYASGRPRTRSPSRTRPSNGCTKSRVVTIGRRWRPSAS
jgi:replicative DNA helicase